MRKVVPAAAIEAEVWDAVRRLLDDREYTLSKVRESFDAKRRELSGPGLDAGKLARRLESLEVQRKGYSRQNARGVLSDKELDEMLSEVDVQRKQVEHALQRARNQVAELEKLDEAEWQIKARIWDGYGGLDDATPRRVARSTRIWGCVSRWGRTSDYSSAAGCPSVEESRLTRRDRSRAASSTRRDRRATMLVA
jgi:hypothetical protein